MGMLDHWHPVLQSRTPKKQPVGIQLAGRMICLFRTASCDAAVDNVCPHRRLKLSYGKLAGDRIRCKYHGWTFDACENGESPGTPKMHTYTEAFDAPEVRQDVAMLEHMAVQDVSVEGIKLSRFDKVLGLTRERIARIYRGERPDAAASAGATGTPAASKRIPILA